MSRFTVGQEITVKEGYGPLEYGKFYPISMITGQWNIIVVENDHRVWVKDIHALTREEYEQAERDKDPFAPGKWVVCVKDDYPALAGDIIQVFEESDAPGCFRVRDTTSPYRHKVCFKSSFRPATPAEIKEMKIMDEKKDDESLANRQTFTVGGQEFYIGQSAWAVGDGLLYKDGDALDVIGMVAGLNFPTNVSVRNKKTLMCFVMKIAGLTTTPPKPHEWKFGDWARHPECGVLFVTDIGDEDEDGDREIGAVMKDGTAVVLGDFELTYISTAEIPE